MTNDVLKLPLRLRRDAIYMKTEGGIMFRARKGAFALRGKGVYGDFQTLLPYLDGHKTGQDALGAGGEDRRRHLSDLLQMLLQRGVVQPADPVDAVALDAATAAAFEPQIEFLRHYADKPRERFAAFRETNLLLTGSGAAFASAGAALLRNGLRTLYVSDSAWTSIEAMERECARQAERHVSSRVVRLNLAAKSTRFDLDLVLYVSERPNLAEVRRLNAQAVAHGFAFLPAYVHAANSIIGPYVDPNKPGCWECAMLRWSDNSEPERACNFWRRLALGHDGDALSRDVTEVAAQMLGNMAALEIFKLRAGSVEAETQTKLLRQDLATLETAAKTILPHPECRVCAQQSRGRVAVSVAVPPSTATECVRRLSPAVDPEFGLLLDYDDEEMEQIPLRVSSTRFTVGATEREPRRTLAALGWSVENSDGARMHAASRAIQYKTQSLLSAALQRAVIVHPRPGERLLCVEDIAGWLGTTPHGAVPESYLEMSTLDGTEALLVPAGAVHAQLDVEKWFDAQGAGLGVAIDLRAAQRQAVQSLYEYRALAGLAHGTLVCRRWSELNAQRDATTPYLIKTRRELRIEDGGVVVAHAGAGIWVALLRPDETNLVRVPDIVFASGFSIAEAANAVLTESIVRAQLARGGHEWKDVPRHAGRYERAEFAVRVEGELEESELSAQIPSLERVAGQAERNGQRVLWLDMTTADLHANGAFRVVKAILAGKVEL